MSANPLPQPVAYPALRIGGVDYQFRYTQSSKMLLQSWGFGDVSRQVPALVWAAALAGFADVSGKFRSAGFLKPSEFTDQIEPEDDLTPIYEAVTEALKKVAPKATVTLVKPPATDSSTADPPAN
jgi:hypothetical protein